jgi:hypothetical protein
MRLFDKVASAGPANLKAEIAKHPGRVLLQVDEIAKHYYMNDQQEWEAKDYPYAIPPWTECFIEWKEPLVMRAREGIVPISNPSQVGVFVKHFAGAKHVAGVAKLLDTSLNPISGMIPSDAVHAATLTPAVSYRGSVLFLNFASFWFMNSNGMIVSKCHSGHGINAMKDTGISDRDLGDSLDTYTHIAALAFTFANCSNVKLEDVTQQEQPPAKIRRRLKLPEVKRYTLNIAGHSTKPRREGTGEPQEGIMPFHLCRGHFATYTPEKPMFGNPKLIGRYWHPPHTRGKKERGEIIKDYAIAE